MFGYIIMSNINYSANKETRHIYQIGSITFYMKTPLHSQTTFNVAVSLSSGNQFYYEVSIHVTTFILMIISTVMNLIFNR